MKTVGIAYNDLIPEALDLAHAIVGELNLGANSWILRAEDAQDLSERAQETDMVITIGGDGTILRVNRAVAPMGIPLLGINMGRLGFMTELTVPGVMEQLPRYLNGEVRVSEHSMLMATVHKRTSNGIGSTRNARAVPRPERRRPVAEPGVPRDHGPGGDRWSGRIDVSRGRRDFGDGDGQHGVQLCGGRAHHRSAVRRPGAHSVWRRTWD